MCKCISTSYSNTHSKRLLSNNHLNESKWKWSFSLNPKLPVPRAWYIYIDLCVRVYVYISYFCCSSPQSWSLFSERNFLNKVYTGSRCSYRRFSNALHACHRCYSYCHTNSRLDDVNVCPKELYLQLCATVNSFCPIMSIVSLLWNIGSKRRKAIILKMRRKLYPICCLLL